MVTESYIIYIKTKDFYEDVTNDVSKCFDTSNYSEEDKEPFQEVSTKKLLVFLRINQEER